MPWNILLRDLVLLGITLAVLGRDASLRATASPGAFAVGVAATAGLLLGLVGYLAHEWGHLLGARLSRSTLQLPRSAATVFTFFYDTERNSPKQFLAMSFGGFAASGVIVALYVSLLPLDALSSRVALLATALGVLATVVLEFPVAWRVYRGAGMPMTGVAYVSARNSRP